MSTSPCVGGTDACVQDVLVRAGLQPAGYKAESVADQDAQNCTSVIVTFLLNNVPEYRRLADLRRSGWENPEGNKFFKRQRRNADKTDEHTSRYHFNLMRQIGKEMHNSTMAFATRTHPGSILDMCVAPGGFLKTAMDLNLGSQAVGFSLPHSQGGYKVLLPADECNPRVRFLDITMLAEDMGVLEIPESHPEADKFFRRQMESSQLFELVLCDGQVLRTHKRLSYREGREAARLKTTQLALGLEHLQPKGTMVVLFQKVESWETVCFLYRFSKFSTVKLFKPKCGHGKRSSFYMIATNVQSQSTEAALAIKKWKEVWRWATFGSDAQFAEALGEGEDRPEKVLEAFGAELVRQGAEVWAIQADALAKAPFIPGKGQ